MRVIWRFRYLLVGRDAHVLPGQKMLLQCSGFPVNANVGLKFVYSVLSRALAPYLKRLMPYWPNPKRDH
jgi:hypothetical protein